MYMALGNLYLVRQSLVDKNTPQRRVTLWGEHMGGGYLCFRAIDYLNIFKTEDAALRLQTSADRTQASHS